MGEIQNEPSRNVVQRVLGRGRPRSDQAHRAILDATRELIIEGGLINLRLEHVAARAGVGKATIYRRWDSKEEIALELLRELSAPFLAIEVTGDTAEEMRSAVDNTIRSLNETGFGTVVKALLSQIASNPTLGDPFRATVVQARRDEIAGVVERGIQRGDLRLDADTDVVTELLVGPVYFRLIFGGALTDDFANQIVNAVLHGYAAHVEPAPLFDTDTHFGPIEQLGDAGNRWV